MAKKKIGPAGRFGPRYGKMIRAAISKIEKEERKRHICPRCNLPYVKRISTGIWKCRKCGTKFAGLAYYPKKE